MPEFEILFLPWDYLLLKIINVDLAHPALDYFWRTITQLHKQPLFMALFVPLILFRLIYIYRTEAWKLIVILTLAIGLTDALSYRVVKQAIHRQRPFQNQEISAWVRKVGQAHGSSFPSNHAANVFAGAAILSWYFPGMGYLFYIFAALIAISRVALGVHYPSDVLAGAILGNLVGFLVRSVLLNQFPYFQMRRRVSIMGENSYTWRTRNRRMEER